MSKNISEKTLQDLEFTTILTQISEFCISSLGKEKVSEIKPIVGKQKLLRELYLVDEYLSSFVSDNRIPNHGFDNILESIKRLAIENSFLETDAFLKIATTSNQVQANRDGEQKLAENAPGNRKLEIKILICTYGFLYPFGHLWNE